jgi:hypothetical protein
MAESKNEHAVALGTLGGSKGGRTRAQRLSPEERSEIARLAAEKRWEATHGESPRATHEGVLTINGIEIPCAVLKDGQRLITLSGLMQALGRARQAKGRQYYRDDDGLPVFMSAQNLKPFITKDLLLASAYVEFRPLRGPRAFGFRAEILPNVCDMFLEAEEAGALTKQQQHIAARAKILIRGLAHVGIIALVDEATGYQQERARDALAKILEDFIAKELRPWVRTFPPEFYAEMYRLNGWQLSEVPNAPKPRVVGKYTDDLVYKRLAPGVRDELKRLTLRTEKGYLKNKLHQRLTDEVGNPKLREHLAVVVAFMKAANSWPELLRLLDRARPRYDKTLPLDLDD